MPQSYSGIYNCGVASLVLYSRELENRRGVRGAAYLANQLLGELYPLEISKVCQLKLLCPKLGITLEHEGHSLSSSLA